MAVKPKLTKWENYVRGLRRRLPEVVPTILAEATMRVYGGVLERTKVDSGQALNQWYILPSKGARAQLPAQEVQWGYGSVTPVAPVGWKARYSESDQNLSKDFLVEFKMQFYASAYDNILNSDYTRAVVFNPITPGMPGFGPGSDDTYEDTALGEARSDQSALAEQALEEAYNVARAKFPDLMKRTRGPR